LYREQRAQSDKIIAEIGAADNNGEGNVQTETQGADFIASCTASQTLYML